MHRRNKIHTKACPSCGSDFAYNMKGAITPRYCSRRCGVRRDTPPALERYEPELNTGCWLWSAGTNSNGYGAAMVEGKVRAMHRYFYEQHKGPIAAGLVVCHRCDTPACVNPDHLFLGTVKDNALDAQKKGRLFPMGKGENHLGAKLTEAAVRIIRREPKRNGMRAELAARFGVSPLTIGGVRGGRSWPGVA